MSIWRYIVILIQHLSISRPERVLYSSCINRIQKLSDNIGRLACGQNNIFTNKTLAGIAKAHGKTAAQVALRFLAQQGIAVIPKSTREERMKENREIFDFELEISEMQAIEQLEIGRSFFGWW